MRDKTKLENGGNLESVPDCYKIQQMYDKAVNNYLHLLKFVADYYITQKICDKTVDTYSTIEFVTESYKSQEMCDKAVNRCFLAFIYIPDQ